TSPPAISAAASASRIACPGDCGVDDVLSAVTAPVSGSSATMSVNVPPVSMPTTRPTLEARRALADAVQVGLRRPQEVLPHPLGGAVRVPPLDRVGDPAVLVGDAPALLRAEAGHPPRRRH